MAQNLIVEPNSDETDFPGDTAAPNNFQLGIEGFAYGDLYRPERLRDLAEAFYAEVERADPALHAALAEYVASRGERVRGTKAESDLLIAAAPHLSERCGAAAIRRSDSAFVPRTRSPRDATYSASAACRA